MGKTIDQVQEGIVIGNAPDKKEDLNRVIMGPSSNSAKQNNHRVIKPNPKAVSAESKDEETSSIPQRQVVSIDQIFPEEEKAQRERDESLAEKMEQKIQDEIFDGKDSPFMKAIKRKVNEMDEWVEQQREEKELEEAEKEFNEELDSFDEDGSEVVEDNGEDEETEMTDEDLSNYDIDDDIIMEDDEAEEETEVEETVDKDLEEAMKEDYEVEDIDMGEEKVEAEENAEEKKEDDSAAALEKKEEEVDESIVGADIDIEESEEESEIVSDDDDEEEDEDEGDTTVDDFNEEQRESFKNEIIEKLKPSFKDIDISNFTVVKRANNKLNAHMSSIKSKAVKWVLYNAESCFFMKQFDGSDMENLREYLSTDNPSRELILQAYRIIYDHIVSQKPGSFEQWMKVTAVSDIPHYFFGVYVACFKDANFLPRDCGNSECNNHFVSDNIPIMDMVKFKNEAAKKKFMSIYNDEKQNVATNTGHYASIRTPISSRVAVDLAESTIYRSIESGLLGNDRKFLEKYANTIGICRFIDELYEIDAENNQLVKISYKAFEGNPAKTFRSKIIKYNKVLSTLNADEYRYLIGMIEKLNETVNDDVTYRIPEIVCPKCGTSIPAVENAGAEFLVFFRSQLAALASRL